MQEAASAELKLKKVVSSLVHTILKSQFFFEHRQHQKKKRRMKTFSTFFEFLKFSIRQMLRKDSSDFYRWSNFTESWFIAKDNNDNTILFNKTKLNQSSSCFNQDGTSSFWRSPVLSHVIRYICTSLLFSSWGSGGGNKRMRKRKTRKTPTHWWWSPLNAKSKTKKPFRITDGIETERDRESGNLPRVRVGKVAALKRARSFLSVGSVTRWLHHHFFNIWPYRWVNIKIYIQWHEVFAVVSSSYCLKTKWTLKILPKTFQILPKWQIVAKSGRTVRRPLLREWGGASTRLARTLLTGRRWERNFFESILKPFTNFSLNLSSPMTNCLA